MNNLELLKLRRIYVGEIDGEVVHFTPREIFYMKDEFMKFLDLEDNHLDSVKMNDLRIVRVDHLPLEDKIVVVTPRAIFNIHVDSKRITNLFFTTNKDVVTFCWNNSFDTAAVVFEDGSIATYHFDIRMTQLLVQGRSHVLEVAQDADDIGWGSSSTQFGGTRRFVPVDDDPNFIVPEPTDDKIPRVTWRGNDEYFAINYFHNGSRHVKVFDVACAIDSETLDIQGLLAPIAWKPKGNVIACAVWCKTGFSIVLLEKNGLMKSSFDVDLNDPITDLQWSPCGRVLTVVHQDEDGHNVCLYTTNNSVWFLKQQLYFSGDNDFTSLRWIQADNYCCKLRAITNNDIVEYKFKFRVHTQPQQKFVVVVNGKKLLINRFETDTTPPPLCSMEVKLKNCVNFISFHPTKPFCAIIDASHQLTVFEYSDLVWSIATNKDLKEEGENTYPLYLHHPFWYKGNFNFIAEYDVNKVHLYEFDMSDKSLVLKQSISIEEHFVEHLFACDEILIVQFATTRHVLDSAGKLTKHEVGSCVHVTAKKINGNIHYFSLAPNNEFFIDEYLISNTVTSFLIYKELLMLSNGKMFYSARLSENQIEKIISNTLNEFHRRNIHETISLVCVIPETANVVFETPRGNLQIESCKIIDLDNLEDKLAKKQWYDALYYIRTAKLNWNLLIDLNPERFFENLPIIVKTCGSGSLLNSICIEIQDNSVLHTTYTKCLLKVPPVMENKKNTFFKELMNHLENTGCFRDHIDTVIAICVNNFSVTRAVSYIHDLLVQVREGGDLYLRGRACHGISTLRRYVTDETIFKEALLTFDLDFANFVGGFCQMDPRDYEERIERLKPLDEMDRRHEICMMYGRPDEGIVYLIRNPEITTGELIEFIRLFDVSAKAHKECLTVASEGRLEIARVYAEKLSSQGLHEDAGIVLTRAKLYKMAIPEYILALNWEKLVLHLPGTSFTEEEKMAYINEMGRKLDMAGKHKDSAYVYEIYAKNAEAGVETLLNGKLFKEALHLAKKYDLETILDEKVLPFVLDHLKGMMEQIFEIKDKFKDFTKRLATLREEKKMKYEQKTYEGQQHPRPCQMDDYFDVVSESGSSISGIGRRRDIRSTSTSSQSSAKSLIPFSPESGGSRSVKSSSSRQSQTSSVKQMRKEEKKKQDTREGSIYEDIAIIRELHKLISTVFNYGPNLRMCLMILLEESKVHVTAMEIQHNIALNLQKEMEHAIPKIWLPEFHVGSDALYLVENIEVLDEIYRSSPPEVNTIGSSWKIQMLL